jgi:endo-1,4-beta-D-glucanase Y
MADKQWGGYTTTAKDYLAKVLMGDFGTDGTVKGGDTYVAVNPSYMAPAFYKVFATYTGADGWNTVVTRTYTLLGMAANATTGLVPDWSSGGRGPDYTYDATRTPYRIAVDACWFADTMAQAFSKKLATFFAGIGAANIKDGYKLDGTVSGTYNNASFVGPAGVGAMAGAQQKLVDDAYAYVAKVAADTTANYYDSSWAMFSLLMMTGNFVNFSSP